MLKQQIEGDLKKALLAGDKLRVTTLRSLKSVILYAEVALGVLRVRGVDRGGLNQGHRDRQARLLQEDRDLVAVGGRPVVQLDHRGRSAGVDRRV